MVASPATIPIFSKVLPVANPDTGWKPSALSGRVAWGSVPRVEYLFSAPSVVLGLFIPYKSRTMDDDEDE